MSVLTRDGFKVYRNITATTYDERIDFLIDAVQAKAERYCERTFDLATYTEVRDGQGTAYLTLRNTPIVSIDSITWTPPTGSTVEVDETLYTFDPASGVIKLSADARTAFDLGFTQPGTIRATNLPRFAKGLQNYVIVYDGGYSDQTGSVYTIPPDLQLVLYQMVDELLGPIMDGASDFQQLASLTVGDLSWTRRSIDDLIKLNASRLDPFRRASL